MAVDGHDRMPERRRVRLFHSEISGRKFRVGAPLRFLESHPAACQKAAFFSGAAPLRSFVPGQPGRAGRRQKSSAAEDG